MAMYVLFLRFAMSLFLASFSVSVLAVISSGV